VVNKGDTSLHSRFADPLQQIWCVMQEHELEFLDAFNSREDKEQLLEKYSKAIGEDFIGLFFGGIQHIERDSTDAESAWNSAGAEKQMELYNLLEEDFLQFIMKYKEEAKSKCN